MSYLEQNISINEIESKILKILKDNKTNKKTKKINIIDYIYSEIKTKVINKSKSKEEDTKKGKLRMRIKEIETKGEKDVEKLEKNKNFFKELEDFSDPMTVIPEYSTPVYKETKKIIEIPEEYRCIAYTWSPKNSPNLQCDRRKTNGNFCSIHNEYRPFGIKA
tara:strand:+ start:289 stop:777 length:489 start_codon:yes stop_codon:yes gene_type:complete